MEERIQSILTQMTLDEKLAMLAGADLWYNVRNERLGIPAMKVTDGPNGARGTEGDMAPKSAVFPVGVAMGATWNPELIEEIGQALADETKTKSSHILLAPTVNMHRTPLAGRNFECFSEDPYLTGKIAVGYIKGLQKEGIGACIKHFVCNDQEYERNTMSSEVRERALREIYLTPFRMAVEEAQPWSIMSGYNKINGTWASEHSYLLKDVLKEEWGFDGMVISDWMGTYTENVAAGGLDYEMPGPARWMHPDVVRAEMEAGNVTQDEIDDKIRRILRTIERVGVFENPEVLPETENDNPKHRALIRRTAEQAIVLLKNEHQTLPLAADKIETLAVIGPTAAQAQVLGGGSSRVNSHNTISPLEGIRTKIGEQVEVAYALGTSIRKGIHPLPNDWLTGDGFTFEFFENYTLEGEPIQTKVSKHSEFEFSTNFLENVPDHTCFAVRITGSFTAPEDGPYKLSFSGNGQRKIWINGEQKSDGWTDEEVAMVPWGGPSDQVDLNLARDEEVQIHIDFRFKGDMPWRRMEVACLPPEPANPIAEAVALAQEADKVVLFLGTTAEWEFEGGDRPNLDLPGEQIKLLDKIIAVNPNTIVVLTTAAPVIAEWADKVPAVIQSWYGGEEIGNAVADVLFGDVNPSGRMPQTWPKRLEDNPAFLNYPGENGKVYYGEGLFIGYRYYDTRQVEPRFHFGYGLSYTTFEYSNLQAAEKYAHGDDIKVTVAVTNTGDRAGFEVVQLYVGDDECSLIRPNKELKAFQKVWLEPGETKTVELELDRMSLAFYDDGLSQWVTELGTFTLYVGAASNDIRLTCQVEWAGDLPDTQFGIHTKLGHLLENPASKAVLAKFLGAYMGTSQIDALRHQPLVKLAPIVPNVLTPELLQQIEAELAKIN
jgi:beta-glucosidase